MKIYSAMLWVMVIMVSSLAITLALRNDGWLEGGGPVTEHGVSKNKEESFEPSISVPTKNIEKLEIDLAGKRVFLPGDGWITSSAFWDIYYHFPHKLPGDIDFGLLHELEKLTGDERTLAQGVSPSDRPSVGLTVVVDPQDPAFPHRLP